MSVSALNRMASTLCPLYPQPPPKFSKRVTDWKSFMHTESFIADPVGFGDCSKHEGLRKKVRQISFLNKSFTERRIVNFTYIASGTDVKISKQASKFIDAKFLVIKTSVFLGSISSGFKIAKI